MIEHAGRQPVTSRCFGAASIPLRTRSGMMELASLLLAAGFCCAAAASNVLAQPMVGSFREGLWEMTIRTDVPGIKSMPPMVLKRCISAKEIQDLQTKVTRPPGSEQCRVLDQQTRGNTTSWKIECTGKQKMSGEGSMTAAGDTYSMQSVVVMSMPEGKTMRIASEMNGKRLGECQP